MNPEQIVRALAAAFPLTDYGGGMRCTLCRAAIDYAAEHEPDCPWRLASEWVAAQRDARA